MYYIKAEIQHYQYFDIIFPEFNALLMTNKHIYGTINIVLI